MMRLNRDKYLLARANACVSIKDLVAAGMGYRISTGVSGANNSSGHSKSLSDDEIRSAMGLKGR